ncbi:MAG: transketolase [Spirochaetales bacterium]|nr:transketolase [Spirochaetales bacterium]
MDLNGIYASAKTIRALAMDAVQKAKSGHPGMPMGNAEIASLLYGEVMKYNPSDSTWIDRDRFVLSAGHGSMLLYSILYLAGFNLTLDDIKNFRQLGSKTAGHPEYKFVEGIDTTTGPLGAGISNAVGMAIAETILAEKFNTEEHKVVDHYTYAINGDGCLMEGISAEAASLAGHLGLGKLVLFYDSNKITIEGGTDIAFTEDVGKRFEAYGWQVLNADAFDVEELSSAVASAKAETEKPSIVIMKGTIGKGAATMEGSHSTHGAPLGEEEIKATRKKLGIPEDQEFYVDHYAVEYFKAVQEKNSKLYSDWNETYDAWAKANPELKIEWDKWFAEDVKIDDSAMPVYKIGDSVATRNSGEKALNAVAAVLPNLYGGSADLGPSNKTVLKGLGDYSAKDRSGRNMHFGIREHAMGGIVNGMVLHGGVRAYGSTFLVFVDYMRPAVRLSALMGIPSVWVFTHDSIYVGEDGPTHQPIEHIASLRVIPNLQVLRPADGEETNVAWQMAAETADKPTVLALTRQNLTVFEKADKNWKANMRKGAYVAKDCDGTPDVVVAATGSEVNLAIDALEGCSKKVRVVSVADLNTFLAQDKSFKDSIIPSGVRVVTAEAGTSYGWEKLASSSSDVFCIDRFGESGPAAKVAEHLGFTSDKLRELIEK